MTSTHPALGVRTCIGPLNSGRYKVCNVARLVQDGFVELVLLEVVGVRETIEGEMGGNGGLDLGIVSGMTTEAKVVGMHCLRLGLIRTVFSAETPSPMSLDETVERNTRNSPRRAKL